MDEDNSPWKSYYNGLFRCNFALEAITELETTRFPEKPETQDAPDDEEEEDLDPDAGKSEQQVRDELTGQLRLFDDEEP